MKNTNKKCIFIAALVAVGMLTAGCASSESSSQAEADTGSTVSQSENAQNDTAKQGADAKGGQQSRGITNVTNSEGYGTLDTEDMFSNRDLEQEADPEDASTLTLADGKTVEITEAGTYILSGTAKNCTVKVNADKEDKVQLVLDGVNITNDSAPAIYVVSADKVFITTASGSSNTLSVTGSFTADGDTNTDAVIYSKDDIVLNGLGSLTITSAKGNGITGKDDIKITGGTYSITSELDAIEANDSVRISGGDFTISSKKDGIHCENGDDDSVGWIYISGGTFNITASSDAIQGTTITEIDGGTFTLKAAEGIESTYVKINGGDITISASDDGVNGSQKSKTYGTPAFEMNGGTLTITMGSGDTDAIDINGNVTVNGGTIDITSSLQGSAESFDYDGTATYNGGTIIVNGEEQDSIPTPMMMGGGGFGGGGRGGRGNFNGWGGSEDFDPDDLPEGFDKDNMPGNFGDFDPENLPEGFDKDNMPGGFGNFDPENLPEGFDKDNMPGGFGGRGGRNGGRNRSGSTTSEAEADTVPNA